MIPLTSRHWVLAAPACLLALAVAAQATTVDELPAGAVYTVRRIEVRGPSYLARRKILDAMLLRSPPWYKPWKRWFGEPVDFDRHLFEEDLARVRTQLRESGHFEAEVTHELVVDGEQIDIILHVEEGPPARVAEVGIVAADFAPGSAEQAALRALVTLAPGDVFSQEGYDASRNRLERHFFEQGFAYTKVEKAAVVDTATEEARVTYTITRGIPAVFGQTRVEGLEKLEPKLVEREIAYQPGQPYDPTAIEKTQARIFGLQLFRSVTVEPANLDARTGTVDVLIQVAEGPPRSIKVGIGYGLEDELRAQAQWQHHNFLGGGRRLGVRLKGSFIEQSIEGEFRQPYFLHPRQTLIVPLTEVREDEPGFTVLRTRLAPRLELKLLPELTASVGYNVEYDDLTGVPEETQERLEEFEARGIVSSLTASLERNTSRDLLDPHDGSLVNVTLEQAGGPWQGDFDFYRAVADARKYVGIFADQVIAARLRVGAADAFGSSKDVPMFRRFFAGGINSTRGYARHKLGPLTSADDPVGGRSLLEASLELRTPIYGSLGAVAFVDAGTVHEKPFRYELGDLQYAAGPGIRFKTPVGPLRLDVGFPLNPPAGLPRWEIHFSVGQAF